MRHCSGSKKDKQNRILKLLQKQFEVSLQRSFRELVLTKLLSSLQYLVIGQSNPTIGLQQLHELIDATDSLQTLCTDLPLQRRYLIELSLLKADMSSRGVVRSDLQ